MRGYFGIAFYEPKFIVNIGTAVRSAKCFGASFIAVIGGRYKHEATDAMRADRHFPIFEYKTMQDFFDNGPINCEIVSVEIDGKPIETYSHPERAIYLFGGEDKTLPIIQGDRIRIDTDRCLNMSVSASIVMYDRNLKSKIKMNK